jgi:hypothetical protein
LAALTLTVTLDSVRQLQLEGEHDYTTVSFHKGRTKGCDSLIMGRGCERGQCVTSMKCVHTWSEIFKNGQTSVTDAMTLNGSWSNS